MRAYSLAVPVGLALLTACSGVGPHVGDDTSNVGGSAVEGTIGGSNPLVGGAMNTGGAATTLSATSLGGTTFGASDTTAATGGAPETGGASWSTGCRRSQQ